MPPANYSVELKPENFFDAPLITAEVKSGETEEIRYTFTDIPAFRSTGSGPSPLNFVANTTETSADIQAWTWHIICPDGTDLSYGGNSIQTALTQTGNYTVSLDALWGEKMTVSNPKTVRVLSPPPKPKASGNSSSKINGTTMETLPDGTQVIFINKSKAGNVTTAPDSIIVEKTDGTKIRIRTEETPSESKGNISGKVSSVTMNSPQLNAVLDENLGNASVGVSMTMDSYNEYASVCTEISAGCADDASNAFSIACPDLKDIAYTVYFTKSGFDNQSQITEAVINFSVNTSWVDSMGGPQRITIVRWKDDGSSERINPVYLGISGTGSLFRITTDGFSVYGIAGFSVPDSGHGNPVYLADAKNLSAGESVNLTLNNTLFTEITLIPGEKIPDLRVTAEKMDCRESSMGMLKDGNNITILEYVKTVLYFTTSSSLDNITYTAEIPETWLQQKNGLSFPAVWYYNKTLSSWNMLEIINTTTGNGNKIIRVEAEMPGFGWFAIGSVPDRYLTGEETLPPGPGPEIISSVPEQTKTPHVTQSVETTETEKTETTIPTPLSGIVAVFGTSLAAAVILLKRSR